jgi:hypothetical protein
MLPISGGGVGGGFFSAGLKGAAGIGIRPSGWFRRAVERLGAAGPLQSTGPLASWAHNGPSSPELPAAAHPVPHARTNPRLESWSRRLAGSDMDRVSLVWDACGITCPPRPGNSLRYCSDGSGGVEGFQCRL